MKKINLSKINRRVIGRLSKTAPLVSKVRAKRDSTSVPSFERFMSEFMRDYRPHKKQQLLDQMRHVRYRAVTAGRRGGKTYWGGRAFSSKIYEDFDAWRKAGNVWVAPNKITKDTKPALLYWCVAPTYGLGTYQRQEFFESIGGTDSDLILHYAPSKNEVWLKGGILVQFKSADKPLNLVGSGLSGMWVDEASRLKEGAWDENLEPTLKDKKGWAIFTSTPMGKNWYYGNVWVHCIDQTNPEWFGQHFTTADNTSLPHLAEEMEKARKTLSRPVYLRNYMADFNAFEGKVYEEFLDDSTHIIKRVPHRAIIRRFGGIDWGYKNPGCLISLGADVHGRVYAWAEDYKAGLNVTAPASIPGADSWVKRMRQRDLEMTYGDPARPGNISTARAEGLDILPAMNSVSEGIELVSMMLAPMQVPGKDMVSASLFIHEDLHNLRREMTSYRYGDDDKPVKEHDHSPDALRYGIYTEFKKGDALNAKRKQLQRDFPSIYTHAA